MSNMSIDNKKINSHSCNSTVYITIYKNYILQRKFHMFKRNFCFTSNFEPVLQESTCLSCYDQSLMTLRDIDSLLFNRRQPLSRRVLPYLITTGDTVVVLYNNTSKQFFSFFVVSKYTLPFNLDDHPQQDHCSLRHQYYLNKQSMSHLT